MSDVLATIQKRVGRLRLNRPKALHAPTTPMCEAMLAALEDWKGDGAVELVLLDHAPSPDGDPRASRGFCAGGDIRMLSTSGAGDGAAARAFFRTEYRLNHRLFTYAIPTVAVMDGVTMGGGVGIALPCRWRIATENTRFAMPETAIGLFPDVGGGWYLSRLPGRMGQYLALTGARIDGAACVALGLATHFISAAQLDEVKAALVERPGDAAAILETASAAVGDVPLPAHRADIDRLFASDRVEEVLAALQADDGAFAQETLATLDTRSPQAMKISLKLLLEGATMPNFEDELRQEYAVATRIVQLPDFAEGVRAVIVDKDDAPRWHPATAEAMAGHDIDRIFAPLPDDEAWNPA